MEHYKEADRKSIFNKQVPSVLINYLKYVGSAFCHFLVIIIDKLNANQTQKDDAIPFLKYLVAGNFPKINIIPTIEAETDVIIHTLKLKNFEIIMK
jgi:hypothetical protein